MRTTRGFTLIELMIVVAIIAVLAAVAIPNFLRSRMESNEASAIGDLRTIAGAQVTFHANRARYGTFADLSADPLNTGAGFLSQDWVEGREKSGYVFSLASTTDNYFECFADPETPGVTGTRWFRMDPTGIPRYAIGARPTAASPTISQPTP